MVGFDPSRQLHWVESRVDLRGSSAKEVDKTGLRVIPYNPLWVCSKVRPPLRARAMYD